MFSSVPMHAASTETVVDLKQQEIALTLLRHCQSMKRQETRFRLATGFMILMGFAVIFFLHYDKRSSTSDEPATASQREPTVQAQYDPPGQTFSFEVTAMSPSKKIPLQWRNSTAQNITSISIPTDGLYFVYLNIAYRMPFAKYDTKFQYLAANVTSFGEAYPQGRRKLFFMDTMACVYPNFRNIYIGRLIQLKANDKLEVTATPNELIDSFKNGVFFGGYLVHKLK